ACPQWAMHGSGRWCSRRSPVGALDRALLLEQLFEKRQQLPSAGGVQCAVTLDQLGRNHAAALAATRLAARCHSWSCSAYSRICDRRAGSGASKLSTTSVCP